MTKGNTIINILGQRFLRVLSLFLTTAGLLLSPCTAVHADTGSKYNLNINMTGTVMANGSCVFNQGGTVTIDFLQVKLKGASNNNVELDGDYVKPLATEFTCTGDTAGLLQMRFNSASGTYVTHGGTQVLSTTSNLIGIQLLVNGEAQSMGEWFDINQSSPPTLEAQLVQLSTDNTEDVKNGDTFSASGTLIMAFN